MHALKTSAIVLALGLAGSLAVSGAAQACGHMKSVKAKSDLSVAQLPQQIGSAATGMSIATSDVKIAPLPVVQPQAPATR